MWSILAVTFGLFALVMVVFRSKIDNLITEVRKELDKHHHSHVGCIQDSDKTN